MPITAFVAVGLEHSVANMFIIPLGECCSVPPARPHAARAPPRRGGGGILMPRMPASQRRVAMLCLQREACAGTPRAWRSQLLCCSKHLPAVSALHALLLSTGHVQAPASMCPSVCALQA